MKVLLAGILPVLAIVFLAFRTQQGGQKAGDQAPGEILGWRVENGRFAEGPFKGYLCQSPERPDKIVRSEEEWQKILTPEQYRILRNQGTEPAFCGRFYDNHQEGYYTVVGCGQPVFKSDHKFDSGTGWPSFFQPYDQDAIWLRPDYSHGMVRLEVLCSKCDGHLGHVFTDGPKEKGGLRFCINSEVLEFHPKKADSED
ncbi:MAG: peptide-methionine (R)-S-oxide reductase [Armatimonadetes bacterium]|nr:MAG: peptide-methionine (R)-S-oxide reductase [Armatimonadota bacterium]GIV02992.1 MAG: hypothetical protein KatS3mg015_1822 [Fimbriimonadales bacterium]